MEDLQMKIVGALKDHVTFNAEAQKKINFFSRILGKIPELRTLSQEGLQRMFCMKMEDLVPTPQVLETLFATSLPY